MKKLYVVREKAARRDNKSCKILKYLLMIKNTANGYLNTKLAK